MIEDSTHRQSRRARADLKGQLLYITAATEVDSDALDMAVAFSASP